MSYDDDELDEQTTSPADPDDDEDSSGEEAAEGGFDAVTVDLSDETARRQLRGMYQN